MYILNTKGQTPVSGSSNIDKLEPAQISLDAEDKQRHRVTKCALVSFQYLCIHVLHFNNFKIHIKIFFLYFLKYLYILMVCFCVLFLFIFIIQ